MTINPVEFPELLIVLDGIVVKNLLDTGFERLLFIYNIISILIKKLKYLRLVVHVALGLYK